MIKHFFSRLSFLSKASILTLAFNALSYGDTIEGVYICKEGTLITMGNGETLAIATRYSGEFGTELMTNTALSLMATKNYDVVYKANNYLSQMCSVKAYYASEIGVK
jgi:hypothetical protein